MAKALAAKLERSAVVCLKGPTRPTHPSKHGRNVVHVRIPQLLLESVQKNRLARLGPANRVRRRRCGVELGHVVEEKEAELALGRE